MYVEAGRGKKGLVREVYRRVCMHGDDGIDDDDDDDDHYRH